MNRQIEEEVRSFRLQVIMTPTLAHNVAQAAASDHVSRNGWIIRAIYAALTQHDTALTRPTSPETA